MSFDALTMAAVRDELEPLLTGARVQKLIVVDELSLAVEVFAPGSGRTNVLFSADLEHARIQRIAQLPARGGDGDSPFSLLVRKHLRNARVRSVHQPRLERVFELYCEQRDVSDRPYRVVLIVEAMGRRSNLVLVDGDGVILDAARRTPPSRSRRPILPHLPYAPPPPQDRLMPEDLSSVALAGDGLLEKRLAQKVAGLSPLAAREIAYRARDADAAAAAREFLRMLETHQWEPTVAFDEHGPLEYAPYALTHLASTARLERFASISDAMERYYGQARSHPRGDPLAAERKALLVPLERAANTTTRRIAALEHQLTTSQAERDGLRRAGDLLLAHQTEIPEASDEVVLEGEHIRLDPDLTPVENAQEYFARYRKARETEARVPALLEEARNQAEYLAELRALVEVAEQMDAIRALRREVAAATGTATRSNQTGSNSKLKPKSKSKSKSSPYLRVALGEGWEALVGTSAEGNATVTFDIAASADLWLHARGVPGAHVILRRDGSTPSDAVIEHAAKLAASHSAARGATAVEVDVTPRRYVKKIPQGLPGLVRYANERTIRVSPGAEF
jgi:predicted ribosome quality control (RQC) complex YloA/Tae2 family protein